MEIEMYENEDGKLTVQARAVLALNASKTETHLLELAQKTQSIVAVTNKAGRDECHSAAMVAADARIQIEKTSKAARDDATKFSKAIIQEEKRLVDLIEPEGKRLKALRDAWDEKIAAEKAAKEAAERARISTIHRRIAEIRGFATLAMQCRTAARIQELIDKLAQSTPDFATFEEFQDEAKEAFESTTNRLVEIHSEKFAEEAERARVKAELEAAAAQLAADRAALEKERAELAAAKAAAAKAIEDAKPKAKTVDAYEQELQAFAAVVTPHPVSSIGAASEPEKAVLPHTPAPKALRPTDMEIVEVLTNHYRVHESKVLEWLLAMDLDAVNEAIAAEFV
jgi:chromosome segregation ATPase